MQATAPVPIIINADDFGYSPAVNRAIIKAHRDGVITSTSLMVNERGAAEAVALARENPSLAVGLHLALVLGYSTLGHQALPHIVNAEGRFSDSGFQAGVRYYFSLAARRELRLEMRAQFERFAATGLPFSHVDGHTHLHMHPVIFSELVMLCEEYGVRRLRVVRGELDFSRRLGQGWKLSNFVVGTVFNLLARHCRKKLRGRGFTVPDHVYGLLQSGNVNESCLLRLLEEAERMPCEIYSHPLDENAGELERNENPGGIAELQALLSPRVRAAIHRSGFSLSTYEYLSKLPRPEVHA